MLKHTHSLKADDEEDVRVSQCRCMRCENIWWVRHAPEHQPSYCPYCGLKFLWYTGVDGDPFDLSGLPRG
ncbi:MAG: hypothetical protein JWO38_4889 [Gemmataceae bacterium]|nr:hypothetical protein [Gemmataceae bacterium]